MEQILVWALVGLFMIMVVIALWVILEQRKLAKYLPFLLVVWFMATPVFAQDNDTEIEILELKPMFFPEPIKTAATSLNTLVEDLLWRAGIEAWLGNDTNLTNLTRPAYA